MTVHLERRDPTVDRIVRAAFPNYRGRDIQAHITPTCRFTGTMWDEGSRNSYVLVRLEDMAVQFIPREQFMVDSAGHHADFPIPEGMVVVCYHQCRADHITIYSPSANITKALEAPLGLSRDEKIVLVATRSRKPSYQGIKNYRFHEARRETGITLERWEAAKASCTSKGLLNKAGAITVPGRNAAPFPEDLYQYRERPVPAIEQENS